MQCNVGSAHIVKVNLKYIYLESKAILTRVHYRRSSKQQMALVRDLNKSAPLKKAVTSPVSLLENTKGWLEEVPQTEEERAREPRRETLREVRGRFTLCFLDLH